MKKLLYSIIFAVASVAMYATGSLTCDDYSKVDILSTGGTIATTQDPDNHCHYTLVATPAAGYKLAYWTDIYGIKSIESTLNITNSATTQNLVYQATFVRAKACIHEWTANELLYRSDTTDVLSGSADDGYVETYIDGSKLEEEDNAIARQDYGLWSRPISELIEGNTYAGKQMHMVIFNSCDQPSAVIDTIVPVAIASDADASDIDFHSAVDNTSVQVFDGATLTIDENTEISGILDIHAGGKVIVESGKNLTVEGIIMRGNGITKKWPQLAVNGTITNNNNDTIYYDYTLDQSQYYPFSLPYEVAGSRMMGPVGGRIPACIVYTYSGENRENGENGWVKYSHKTGSFEAGKGYAIISQPLKWNGTRQQEAVVRFPMVADLSSGEDEERLIDIYTNASSEASAQDRNWNCIGNPYLANIEMGYQPYNVEGTVFAHQGFQDGSSFITQAIGLRSPKYFTYSNDGFYTYIQDDFEHFELLPFNSYFTQTAYGDKIMFGKIHAAAAPQRTLADDDNTIEDLKTGILLTQDDRSDRINLVFGNYTYDYELNADLVKMFGSAQPLSAYSLMADATPLAFQALPEEAMNRPVALGYRKAAMTPMTFSFDDKRYDRSLLDALWLTDQVTGKVTNLMLEDYTFMPEATQDDNRFFLSLEKRKVVDVTTAVDEVNQERTITHIYDMLGREINTSYNMLPQGVYVITDNLGTTRKEIIR